MFVATPPDLAVSPFQGFGDALYIFTFHVDSLPEQGIPSSCNLPGIEFGSDRDNSLVSMQYHPGEPEGPAKNVFFTADGYG